MKMFKISDRLSMKFKDMFLSQTVGYAFKIFFDKTIFISTVCVRVFVRMCILCMYKNKFTFSHYTKLDMQLGILCHFILY